LKSLDVIKNALSEKPDLKVSLVQVARHESEKELLALSLAKQVYYRKQILQPAKDSLNAKEMSAAAEIPNKDSLFNVWLNQQLLPEDVSVLPSQLKCRKFMGEAYLNQQVGLLFAIRNKMILDYLVNEKKIDATRIKITITTDENSAQFESTPHYKVEFVVDE